MCPAIDFSVLLLLLFMLPQLTLYLRAAGYLDQATLRSDLKSQGLTTLVGAEDMNEVEPIATQTNTETGI